MINITSNASELASKYALVAAQLPTEFKVAMDDVGQATLKILQKNVNVKTGALRDSITYKLVSTSSGYKITFDASAQAVSDGSYYGNYVDQGTKPHIIRVRNKKALHFFDRSGNEVFAQAVYHPGYKGSQFTSKSVEEASKRADTILKTFGDTVMRKVAG